jgi:hypothetical protein
VPFALWLSVAFAAVAVIAMGSIWVLARVGGARDQRALVESLDESYLRQVVESLEASYAANQSWVGVVPLVADLVPMMPRRPVQLAVPGIPGPPGPLRPRRLVLRDVVGRVVADVSTEMPGRGPAPVRPIAGLRFEGREVGMLLATMPGANPALLSAPPDEYLDRGVDSGTNLTRVLAGGAVIGGLAAIVVGGAVLRPLATGVATLHAGLHGWPVATLAHA